MADLRDWLSQHGLEGLSEVLIQSDVDIDVVADLTDQDLIGLGISLGNRRRFLKAAAELAATPGIPAAAAASAASEAHEAERRQVTVMFCDLVGSTDLSTRLDPEDLAKLVRRYQEACSEAIAAFEGFLAKLMGDGVLAYFGFPRAHEDAAERAVRAACAIIEGMREHRTPDGSRLHARIGIATGLVVVGDIVGTGVAREQTIVGETPNLAARLQSLAAPDTIYIADGTRRLLGGVFELEDAGAHAIKGFAQPLPVWRVLREAAVTSRFAAGRTTLPFIGRANEIGLLLDRWQLAREGEGQFVMLTGEAGIGKSRLLAALRERCEAAPFHAIELQSSPHHVNTALYPIARHIELISEQLPERPVLRPFLELIGFARADGDGDCSPAQRKSAGIAAFIDYVAELAAERPVLFVLEDVHWVDATTSELLTRLIDAIAHEHVLVIVTARPEFTAPWIGRAHASQLRLSRLGRADCAEMVTQIAAAAAIPPAMIETIVSKTDGIPLYIEEVTKTLLEAGAGGTTIPATLHDSLVARLDRLGEAKQVAQMAAVIGRRFSYALLAAVAQLGERTLEAALGRLTESEIVFPDSLGERGYSFKHALMRDAAYDGLLRTRRRELHARVATALETCFPASATEEPELLAYHFGEAGSADASARYHERAADIAASHSAYQEAVAHLTAALEQLGTLPQGEDRTTCELTISLKLTSSLAILKGMRSAETADASQRAYALARTRGDGTELFKATWNVWLVANMQRRRAEAYAFADELLALAHRIGDDDLVLEALHCRWSTTLFRGEFAETWSDVREGLRRYDETRHHALSYAFGGHDAGVCAYGVLGTLHQIAGNHAEAAAAAESALELAGRLDHPSSITHACTMGTLSYQLAGDFPATRRVATRLAAVAERYEFPPPRAVAAFMLAWLQTAGGDLAGGLAAMEAAFPQARDLGVYPEYYATLLAAVRLQAGRTAEALSLAGEVLASVRVPDQAFYMPELLRIWAEGHARNDGAAPPVPVNAVDLASYYEGGVAALRGAIAET